MPPLDPKQESHPEDDRRPTYRELRPDEFDPNIRLKPETERYFDELKLGDGIFENLHSYAVIEKYESWCKEQNRPRRCLRKIDTDKEDQRPIAKKLEEYWAELRGAMDELSKDSPTYPVRAHVVTAYHIERGGRSYQEVALVEIINRDGQYLAFNGESLEVNRGGPVFNHLAASPEDDVPQCVHHVYSESALQERLEALVNSALPSTQASYSKPGDSPPHLMIDLSLALEGLLSTPTSPVIPDFDEIEFNGLSDTPNVIHFSFQGQELLAKVAPDPAGFLDIAVAYRAA